MAWADGMEPITNDEDIIDSREVEARLEYLESLHDPENGELLDDEEAAELGALRELAEEGRDYAPDWHYGATLIRDSYFEEYARELAEDLGCIAETDTWPAYCIDWERAARELQMDYTSVDFDGVTYWVR